MRVSPNLRASAYSLYCYILFNQSLKQWFHHWSQVRFLWLLDRRRSEEESGCERHLEAWRSRVEPVNYEGSRGEQESRSFERWKWIFRHHHHLYHFVLFEKSKQNYIQTNTQLFHVPKIIIFLKQLYLNAISGTHFYFDCRKPKPICIHVFVHIGIFWLHTIFRFSFKPDNEAIQWCEEAGTGKYFKFMIIKIALPKRKNKQNFDRNPHLQVRLKKAITTPNEYSISQPAFQFSCHHYLRFKQKFDFKKIEYVNNTHKDIMFFFLK